MWRFFGMDSHGKCIYVQTNYASPFGAYTSGNHFLEPIQAGVEKAWIG
jgi:hypothetical protein